MIKFNGADTQRIQKWTIEGNTVYDVLLQLQEKDVISYEDLELRVSDEIKNFDELEPDEQVDKIYDYISELSDGDLKFLISRCNGAAFYQKWTDIEE
ncbi:MAG: hypothetical protein ABF991_00050 [Liquorilactobacillus hordei]|uniref:hypothetical protein n=1 Tax=Liquorilactobacillus hordei TaxID=468911 RepID=UPI0039EC2820